MRVALGRALKVAASERPDRTYGQALRRFPFMRLDQAQIWSTIARHNKWKTKQRLYVIDDKDSVW